MSKQALIDFANALGSDPELARGLAAAIGGRREDGTAEAVVDYARERGFAVGPEAAAALQAAAGDGAGIVADDQLDGMSGGKGRIYGAIRV